MPLLRTYSRRRRRRRDSRLSPTRSRAPYQEEEHVVETASAKARADPLYAKEGHVPSYIAATSSSCQQADAVAQDTEVLPPSGSCLSSSPASHVWARHVKDWGLIFYIRVDLQGSFHTYPDVGGPFQSSQEADKAIDRYLEDHRDPKMHIGQNDDISSMENVIRRCLYWPDGTIKRRTKSFATWEAKKRMHQFIQALVDKYNDDHNLLGVCFLSISFSVLLPWLHCLIYLII
jgi:hypothetical protein